MDAHLPPHSRDLSVGTRVCLLLAGLLVVAAGYLLIAPLERESSQGPPFDCGTALAPARGAFAESVCGDLNQRRQLQVGAVVLGALVLAGGGWIAFRPLRRRRGTDLEARPAGPPSRSGPPAGPEWHRPASRPALPTTAVPPAPRAPETEEQSARAESAASDAGSQDPGRS